MNTTNQFRNYSAENIEMINTQFTQITDRFDNLKIGIVAFGDRIENLRAREYIINGVGRRHSIVYRCISNIFKLFPVERIEKLQDNDLFDCDINLHAMIINIHGILENLNLALAHGYKLFDISKNEERQKYSFGLFNKKYMGKIGGRISEYFASRTIRAWYEEYSKKYRDSLTHRIPAYIPPAALNDSEIIEYNALVARINEINRVGWTSEISELLRKIERIGVANSSFVHSAYEKSIAVALHPQILSDYLTIEEMINKVIDNFDLTIAST